MLEVDPEDVALPPEPPSPAVEDPEPVTLPLAVEEPVLSDTETVADPVPELAADVDASVVVAVDCVALPLVAPSVEEASCAVTSAGSTAAQSNDVSRCRCILTK